MKKPRLTEKAFLAQVVALAKLKHWLVYHTHDSRRSAPGFPDLVLVRVHPDRPGRLLVLELKAEGGRLTAAQRLWIDALRAAGVEAGVARPGDWDELERLLD